jgi:hypothetical protein
MATVAKGGKAAMSNGRTDPEGRQRLYRKLKEADKVSLEAGTLAFIMAKEMEAAVGCKVYVPYLSFSSFFPFCFIPRLSFCLPDGVKSTVPHKPFFPEGIVPDVLSMLHQEPVSVSRIRELQQPLLKLLQPQVNTLIPNLVFHQYSFELVCIKVLPE